MNDADYMARAVQLARQGWYTTRPNPRVGCVLVRDGQVVGEGAHLLAGTPHAEVHALQQAGNRAQGATAYVTLEPCSHFGRTPPCADALIAAGVQRVVIGLQDPNPLVAGKGIARLRQAGIEVVQGVLENEAVLLNPGYIQRMQTGRPRVRIKLAMSLDGRTAMANGESCWITGAEARQDVQRLRAESCAVVTGIGSVVQDDSRLTVRDPSLLGLPGFQQPLRVLLDSSLRLPLDAQLLQQPGELLVVGLDSRVDAARQQALQQQGVELWLQPGDQPQVDLSLLLDRLAGRGCNEVLIEAGARLAGSWLAAGLVDELLVYMAPKLLGDEGRGLLHLPQLQQLSDAIELDLLELQPLGRDLRLRFRPSAGTESSLAGSTIFDGV